MSPSRATAFDVLLRVEEGAFATVLLLHAAKGLTSRDAGLAQELVLGTLRSQSQLDHLIRLYSGRDPQRLDVPVRLALRLGIYQLRYLDRIPRHAAVSESVDLVKRARKTAASGLVNAILRKVNRDPVAWPDLATALSHPQWLLDRWTSQFGQETATCIAEAGLRTPATYLRVPVGRELPTGVEAEPTDVPGCFRLIAGDPAGLRIQDIGSQTIVPLLDLQAGQTVLDLCAAPGNKTAQMLESPVRVIAGELHLSRAREMQGVPVVVLDGTQALPFRHKFDRILLDAPCSGTGTLARNPEIKWRIQPTGISVLAAQQEALLSRALAQLKPGGTLVYATCSLEHEENRQVVEAVLSRVAGSFRVTGGHQRLPGVHQGDGFYAAVITSEDS